MEETDAIEGLSSLAHPGRLGVFRLLVQAGPEGVPAGEIARRMDAPLTTMSAQLAVLTRAGLIRARRESRSIIYTADYEQIRSLLGFLLQDCCQGRPEICGDLAGACAPSTCPPEIRQ
jgi:ArsR family transcriptional regulator